LISDSIHRKSHPFLHRKPHNQPPVNGDQIHSFGVPVDEGGIKNLRAMGFQWGVYQSRYPRIQWISHGLS
jgi:hypothetical protein